MNKTSLCLRELCVTYCSCNYYYHPVTHHPWTLDTSPRSMVGVEHNDSWNFRSAEGAMRSTPTLCTPGFHIHFNCAPIVV